PLLNLRRSLSAGFSGADDLELRPAVDLLGLGPGLTPSGDDLLAGLLITCHRLGERPVAWRVGDALLRAAPERTTRISLSHLAAAAAGGGAAPLHGLLEALAEGDRVEIVRTLDAAAKIGHSSGYDALGGIILALQAWLNAAPAER
ncbi:MAG: DUF2877 domain-containing protein, partial [Geminicoccaceae bacterium]